jgi:predicted nucleic acid-binding protein
MKALIDSDVCLDFITGRKPHFNTSTKLFNEIYESELTAVASPDSFLTMFYILRQQYDAKKVIPKLKALRSLCSVLPLTEKHIDLALDSGWDDFEDAMQLFCARAANCNAIITRNVKDFSKSSLPVFTPFDFLDR